MKIALLGDIAFFGKFDINQNPKIKDYFKEVGEYLSQFDYVVGNLETPFSIERKKYGAKSAHIMSPPENITILKQLNVNIVNLANNHIFDYGEEGYKLTKEILTKNSIEYFGIDNKEILKTHESNRIAFHGYCCYSTNPLGMQIDTSEGVHVLNVKNVKEKMFNFHNKGYNNIIGVHYGQEHVNYPGEEHIRMARSFANVCPYVFYGHHPHVLQGIENIQNSYLLYSLGNFCFDDVFSDKSKEPLIKQSKNNKQSMISELTYEGNVLVKKELTPTIIGENKMHVGNPDIIENIKIYSDALKIPEMEYLIKREKLIDDYINSRKSKRDFNWYIKRLNWTSVKMVLNSRKNAVLYKKNISNYLP